MLNHQAMDDHDHDHEMHELTDDELDQVSGGAPKPTTCGCRRHLPVPVEEM